MCTVEHRTNLMATRAWHRRYGRERRRERAPELPSEIREMDRQCRCWRHDGASVGGVLKETVIQIPNAPAKAILRRLTNAEAGASLAEGSAESCGVPRCAAHSWLPQGDLHSRTGLLKGTRASVADCAAEAQLWVAAW